MRPSAVLAHGLLAVGTNGAKLMSRATNLPASIQVMSTPSGDQTITLQLGLKLQNLDQLEERLKAVSSPDSPTYGKYIDADEVNQLFAPSSTSRLAVLAWLREAGVTDVADHGSYVNFATNVSTANNLLGSKFQNFRVERQEKLRTLEYSVPNELAEHIELITPTTFFGKSRALAPIILDVSGNSDGTRSEHQETTLRHNYEDKSTDSLGRSPCTRGITPKCLEEMYKYGSYKADPATSGSRVGFGSFLNASACVKDLNRYQTKYSLPVTNFSTLLFNGGEDREWTPMTRPNPSPFSSISPRETEKDPSVGTVAEANLDSQFMAAVSKKLPMTQFITGGRPPFVPSLLIQDETQNTNEPYLEYYQHLMNLTNAELPQVISNSYGEEEWSVPKEYATRVCNLVGMMGLRGVTVLQSSGDSGVGAGCRANDGSNAARFPPEFPASCPWITAIGGTQAYAPEVAWVASSGGFSDYFKQPWYQVDAVQKYLHIEVKNETKEYYSRYTNFTGRGFPDISAHSHSPSFPFYIDNRIEGTGGTSASAPVVAGIIGLLNDARLRAGKPTMGFINPWLYTRGHEGVLDIDKGAAKGCQGVNLQTGQRVKHAAVIKGASLNATKGWDAATGFGVPDFEAMKELALMD